MLHYTNVGIMHREFSKSKRFHFSPSSVPWILWPTTCCHVAYVNYQAYIGARMRLETRKLEYLDRFQTSPLVETCYISNECKWKSKNNRITIVPINAGIRRLSAWSQPPSNVSRGVMLTGLFPPVIFVI